MDYNSRVVIYRSVWNQVSLHPKLNATILKSDSALSIALTLAFPRFPIPKPISTPQKVIIQHSQKPNAPSIVTLGPLNFELSHKSGYLQHTMVHLSFFTTQRSPINCVLFNRN